MHWKSVERQGLPGGTVIGALLLLSGAIGAGWLALGLPWPTCRFRDWTGYPCPTCGSTRMAEALLHGRPLEAFLNNPLVFLVLAAVAVGSVVSTVRYATGRPGRRPVLGRGERLGLLLLAIAAAIANWIYLVLKA